MYATCLVLLMLWMGYAWTLRDRDSTVTRIASIRMEAPTFQQNCSAKQVPCIDDCSFLCVEKDAQCVGGVCQLMAELDEIPCNAEKSGVRMMVNDPVPHWSCICKDARFFRGEDCETVTPDTCEHGMFAYTDRRNYVCICLPPYEFIQIGTKPHCVEKKMLGFYDDLTMSREP